MTRKEEKSEPDISWPQDDFDVMAGDTPPPVRRWIEKQLGQKLYREDKICVRLSWLNSAEDRQQRAIKAMQKAGLSAKEIEKLIRLLPA